MRPTDLRAANNERRHTFDTPLLPYDRWQRDHKPYIYLPYGYDKPLARGDYTLSDLNYIIKKNRRYLQGTLVARPAGAP